MSAIERGGGRVVPCEPTQEARERAAAAEAAAAGAPARRHILCTESYSNSRTEPSTNFDKI